MSDLESTTTVVGNNNNIASNPTDQAKNTNTVMNTESLASMIPAKDSLMAGGITPVGLKESTKSDVDNGATKEELDALKDLVIPQNTPNAQVTQVIPETKTIYEKVLVDIDVKKLNFKGTRFEKWESTLINDVNYLFNNPNGIELLKLIQTVSENPSEDENTIIRGYFKDHKSLLNQKPGENKSLGDSKQDIAKNNKIIDIVQEIKEKNPDITNSKIVVYQAKTVRNDKFDLNKANQRIAGLDAQKMAINGLLGGKGRGFEKKINDFFTGFSLKNIYEIYKKSENSSDKNSVYEKESNSMIRSEIMTRISELKDKFKNMKIDLNDPKTAALGKILIARMRQQANLYFKESTFFITSYIDDTQKGKEFFEEDKGDKKVKDLENNKDFNEFSQILNEELAGKRKVYSKLQKKQKFAEEVGTTLFGFKIYDLQNSTSIVTPGIKVGTGLYEKKVEFKKGVDGKEPEGLSIGGEMYKIDGVNNIEDIVVNSETIIITGELYGKKGEFKIRKDVFVDGIQNLILHKAANFDSIDGVGKIAMHKMKV